MAGYFAPCADAAAYVSARAARSGQPERIVAWNLYCDCPDPSARRALAAVYTRLADLDEIASANAEADDIRPGGCACSVFRRFIEHGCPACNPRHWMAEHA